MKPKPGLHRLIKHNFGKLVAAVPQHHHEDPALPRLPRRGIDAVARVTEVHLRDITRLCLDRHCNIFFDRTSLALHGGHQTLHGSDASSKLGLLDSQSVVDRRRAAVVLVKLLHHDAPSADARQLLRCGLWRRVLLDRRLEQLLRWDLRASPANSPASANAVRYVRSVSGPIPSSRATSREPVPSR